ncbi:hypothetical protein V5799_008746 [Amblyomma americanum]|uniref:Uncharacterized protein n=1 Tax=Amblyomma americanum TaxID=6943 RepID=A0AAQ4FE24_AMBAM
MQLTSNCARFSQIGGTTVRNTAANMLKHLLHDSVGVNYRLYRQKGKKASVSMELFKDFGGHTESTMVKAESLPADNSWHGAVLKAARSSRYRCVLVTFQAV